MTEPILKVEGVSKKYCRSIKHTMLYGSTDLGKSFFGLNQNSSKLRSGEFWAVDNISFELRRGDTIGIIGSNGSGKSTLLKMLNGIFMPDKGRIEINGRVGALIEVGAGFHPLLTGKENVYVNGSILGMSKEEIDSKFEKIITFADIGEFVNAPVKHYSSGMYVRLGFSIAVHAEPDILLVDEVLAVGDEEFKRKCITKLNELRNIGKAIILVSHSMELIQGYSSHTMWMDEGIIKETGRPTDIIGKYLKHVITLRQGADKMQNSRGTGDATFLRVRLQNSAGDDVDRVNSGDEVIITAKIKFIKSVENPVFGLLLKNSEGTWVYGTNTMWHQMKFGTFRSGDVTYITFKQRMNVVANVYYIDLAVSYSDAVTVCQWLENAVKFTVESPSQTVGIANLNSQISVSEEAWSGYIKNA